jgi:hypothetical protein
MPDEAGWHWFRFKICGSQATQQQRIEKFIRKIKDEFHDAKINDFSRSLGYWDDYVEVWIPGKQTGAKFLEDFIVDSYLYDEFDGIELLRREWRPSN